MDWKTMLAYVTGSVDENLLLRIEYLVAENRILRAQIKGRVQLSDAERQTLAEIGAKLGKEALEDIAKEPPALILLDVFMPVMNGVEFLEELRQRSAHSDIPVVLMSAVPDNPEVSYAKELGVSKFLRKGDFDLTQLVTTVKETLARQPN